MVLTDSRRMTASSFALGSIDVLPAAHIVQRQRWFTLTARTAIVADPGLVDAVEAIRAAIERETGLRLRVLPHGKPAESLIVLSMNGWTEVDSDDGFALDATPTLVIIGARSARGLSSGIGALLQLIVDGRRHELLDWYGSRSSEWTFPCLYISA